MSQETASEAFERTYIASLAAADKDFVLNPAVPWPTLRTKANPMAVPSKKRRRKGVQSNDQNRNRFIVLAFALIFCDSADKQLVLGDDEQCARLYDDGRYSWIEDTATVLAALRGHYSNAGSRRQAIMAFRQLCEALQYIETRNIYGNAMDNPDGEELNPAHEELQQEAPGTLELPRAAAQAVSPMEFDSDDSNDPDYYQQIMNGLGHPGAPVADAEGPEVVLSAAQMISEEARAGPIPGAWLILHTLVRIVVEIIMPLLPMEISRVEELAEEIRDTLTGNTANETPEATGPEFEHSSASAASTDTPTVYTPPARRPSASSGADAPASVPVAAPDDTASDASTLVLPSSDDESPDATAEPDRRTQETYQGFLHEYQQYIEGLRMRAMVHLQSETMDVSQWRKKKNHAIHAVMAYLCLATMYGDVDGSLEPLRLDWCDAQYVTVLPKRLAEHCMYVLVTGDSVSVHLRGGHKNDCNVTKNITDDGRSPLLAEVLRLWMPHAQSAQPNNNEPHVMIMHVEQKSYGQPFSGNAYGKLLKRTWTGPDSKQLAAPDPHEQAAGEENPKDRHGYGCDWARKVVARARRRVDYADEAARNRTAAEGQGHSDETERLHYRTVGLA